MKAFESFFDADDVSGPSIEVDKPLPLVHTAPSRYAMDILREMKLNTRLCEKFKEKLLYFFYARPAYRKVEGTTSTDRSLAPVVFICKPVLDEFLRAYPFDSGAYDKYLDSHLSRSADRSDYELPNTLLAIRQYIKAIFGNNQSYFDGQCRYRNEMPISIISYCRTNHDLDNLLNLISCTNRDDIDDRCMTVELQSAIGYDLNSNLLAVIVPSFYQNDAEFIRKVKEIGAQPFYYKFILRHRVNECIGNIYNLADEYYTKQGYMG